MFDRLGNAIGGLAGTAETLSGELGYTLKGVFRVVDPDDPRKFFVRFANGNWVSALHYNRVPQKPGMPVLTSTDSLGRPYIIGEDKTTAPSFIPSGQSGNGIGWHIHPRGGGMDYITDTWLLKQLRVAPIAATLSVTITAGSYLYRRHLRWFSVATLDLSPYIPTDIGTIRWVIVALNPASGALVVLPGTAFIGSPPADPALIVNIACYELGYAPLCAVWLQYGDTSLPPFRFEDLRYPSGSVMWFLEDLLNVSGNYASYGYELTYEAGYWVPTAESSGGGGGGGGGGSGTSKITIGNYADARPSSPASGDLFIARDGYYDHEVWDGAWIPYINNTPMTVPVNTNFSWINQGGASVDASLGAIALTAPAVNSQNIRIRKMTAPATPYVITIAVEPFVGLLEQDFFDFHLLFRESSSGKLTGFQVQANSANSTGMRLAVQKWTDEANFSASYASLTIFNQKIIWLRIADNGTNRICSVSADGENWTQIHSVGRTDFLTADQIGFANESFNATFDQTSVLLSWKQT